MPLPKRTMSAWLANSRRLLRLDRHPVHRGDLGRGAGDLGFPALRREPVQQAESDERIDLVEAVEGDDGDPHGPPS
jgi:hypothetical protein